MKYLRKLINLQPGEGKPVLILFIYFFFIVAISITGKTARDTYFLSQYDRTYLPLMFVIVAIVVAVVIALYTRLTRLASFTVRATITGILFCVSLFLIQLRIKGWVIPVLYVWMDVIVTLSAFQVWTLAGEIFVTRQAKRLFSLLAAGGSLAAVVIGFAINPFVHRFGSDYLLLTTIAFVILSTATVYFAKPYLKSSSPVKTEKKFMSGNKASFDSYLKAIALIVGLSALTSTLIDYQFKMTASDFFPRQDQLAGFFGLYYAITGIATLIIQLFFTSRILARAGIITGLLILPTALLMGSTAFIVYPVLMSVLFSKFSDHTFKFTINNTVTQLLWLPVSTVKKQKIKPIIDGTIKTAVEGLAGLFTFLIVKFIAIQYLSIVSILSLIAWITSTFRLRKGYIETLNTAIENRQLNFEELELDITDSAMVQTIERTLNSTEETQQAFALDLIRDMPLESWKESLNKLIHNGSVRIRNTILTMTTHFPDIISNEEILELIHGDDELSATAVHVAGKRRILELLPFLADQLSLPDRVKQATAAEALLTMNQGAVDKARQLFHSFLTNNDQILQILALEQLSDHPDVLSSGDLLSFLNSESDAICNTALSIAEKRQNTELIPAIVYSLESPGTAIRARQVLLNYPAGDVLDAIVRTCQLKLQSRKLIRGIIRTLKRYPDPVSIDLITGFIDYNIIPIFSEAVDALLEIARQTPLSDNVQHRLAQVTRDTARLIYTNYQMISLLPAGKEADLVRDAVQHENKQLLPILLKLGVLDVPETPIEMYIHHVQTKNRQQLPFVLELFEQIYSKEERAMVTPLVETTTLEELCQIGQQLFSELPVNPDDLLIKCIAAPNAWRSATALNFVFKTQHLKTLERINWETLAVTELHQEVINYAASAQSQLIRNYIPDRFQLNQEKMSMFSTLEKTILLKSVPLFKTIPTKDLARVAQIAEEVQLAAETAIFKEGDYGNSMFIVLDGAVRIHRGEKQIASLSKGDCLGEMALLDQEPRSADATVSDDAILLKITQEGFYELMSGNLEIMQGIVKLLTGRLRRAI